MNPLVRLIPSPLVRFFARPYVAGDSLRSALEKSEALLERGVLSTLDLLAEAIETPEIAERNLATYLEMVEAVATRFPDPASRPSLSLKLSSFTTDPLEAGGRARGSAEAARAVAAAARDKGVALTIDMESRHWTDFTLDLLDELHAEGHDHVGTVLQTRLHRTKDDLKRLPSGLRVRLVIGIYREPAEFALRDKRAMKSRMVEFGLELLERGHYVEFATHDEKWIRRFVERALECHGPDCFEIQTLYGVPRDGICGELQERGCTVRQYVPFALGWPMAVEYLRRRLDEFPAMMFLVARNWLR